MNDTIYNEKNLMTLLTGMLKYTTPHPYDVSMQVFMPKGGTYDSKGNYILTIGESKTLFACHVDTVGREIEETELTIEDGWITVKNGKACLGGDDRCGVLCLLALINSNVPGTYIFHVGEERGTIGARFLLDSGFDFTKFDRAIEFDRRDKHSIIYGMSGARRTCSEEFVDALIKQLGEKLAFKGDSGGTYTDVATYMKIIPEVTNLSCGYYNEHSDKEKIDANWLIKEFIPQIIKVDWEALPVKRDPAVDESAYKMPQNYSYNYNHHGYDWDHDDNFKYKHGIGNNSDKSTKNYTSSRCEFCDTWKHPFHDVFITDIKFTLCEDCTSKFYNSWDDGVENEELEEFGWSGQTPSLSLEEEEEEEDKDFKTLKAELLK